ncbi:carbohydrate-binding module family 1 protein [Periconia macrospinosa]|uniref:Alpha-galactosidase n=1 Tax=Periconia macrospinosa TaxID=97972 RepID=A0A2V1DPS3_9PLEO|nr:carbohydrate-binding module family 1 protein [Periconia macrospinosa]
MRYSYFLVALGQAAFALDSEHVELEKRLDNGLGLTPAMGWSSWNVAQCASASERYALDTANKFVSLGLKDLGYSYVNIDDCWSTKARDSSGNLVPDPSKWPNGIKSVADKIHGMGLKMGLYGCVGTMTCAGYPGSWGHETQDAKLLASWGIDFWKHDACYTPCTNGQTPQTCWSAAFNTRPWYETMRNALASVKSTKNIMFNLCQWGRDSVWTWGKEVGNSWRIEGDNWQDWASVQRIGSTAGRIYQYSGPGGFNDLDMLIVGNNKLTENQERLHFGLWAICKSPLILGNDLNKISSASLAIIKNKGIIDINQDKLGKSATTFQPPGSGAPVSGKIHPYWAGPLSDGVVIGLVAINGATTMSVNFKDVPGLGSGTYSWKEMYSGRTGSGTSVSFSLGTHDMAVVKVTTSGGSQTTQAPTSSRTSTSAPPQNTGGGCQSEKWTQCGGNGYTGCTSCASGSTCSFVNGTFE